MLMVVSARTPLILLCLAACARTAFGADAERVKVNFYGEALCPYCAKFLDDIVWRTFNNGVMNLTEFKYIPWGNAHFTSDGVTCQHGPAECDLNRILGCAIHLYPDQNVWFPFAKCIEARGPGKVQPLEPAQPCANETDLDYNIIEQCASGELGDKLQQLAANETAGLHPAHTYVPWVTVNGIALGGAFEQLQTFVCTAYTGKRPDACYKSPQVGTTAATYTNLKQVLLQLGHEQHAHP